jgi:hypothetical protein
MTKASGRGVRFSPTSVLILVVLALAGGALISSSLDTTIPGTLRLGVLAGESPLRVERAVGPLARWLGEAVGRAGEVVAPGTSGLEELSSRCDVMLVTEARARDLDVPLILAWLRPVSSASARVDLVVISTPDSVGEDVCGVATEGLAQGPWPEDFPGCESVEVAGSPFAERELLRAFVAGAYRAVMVRENVVEDARLAGWLGDRAHVRTPAGSHTPWMALVASEALDPAVRRGIRDAALNLDKYRLDPSHARAGSVLHALAEFGIGGFVAVEPFAALRK